MLLTLLMTMSFMYLWLNHPISVGISIIAQTIIVAMITGILLKSFWYSYIIVITMLSGMLVLFIYMASVSSNEKFYPSIKLTILLLTITVMSMIWQLSNYNLDNDFMMNTPKMSEVMSLNSLFNCKTKMITMLMVLYLLFSMITVSSIVNISEGPLRMFKK
nr:NADH-ubiquinone oxidoreductase chain 6 [Laminiceps obscurior]